MRSKLIYVIFAIVVLMAGIIVAICLAEPVVNAGGLAHPAFPGMQVGGDGAARLEHIGYLAFAFQCLLLLLIVCLCLLGVAEKHRSNELIGYLGACFILMIFVWWKMYSGHQQFLDTGITTYFMGFPAATAWQVYGTWFGAIPLILIYSMGFRKWILTEDDERQFEQLLAEKNSKSE